jgi:2,4-dienoyl-CoA reductase-like NADH-dependent reductase (Old Yellow Enzyme family)
MKNGLSRREILKLSAVALAGTALPPVTGCQGGGPAATSDTVCLTNIPQKPLEIDIFAPASIGKIRLQNRTIRSATTIHDIDERGLARPGLMRTYKELAQGGVGCVITGMKDGGMLLNDFRYQDADAAKFKEVPALFHKHNIPVVQQISHEGRQESFDSLKNPFVTNLSPARIESLIDQYVDTTATCQKLGFDGVQLHCAHGYLLSEFLSPSLNERTDAWGGSTEKRFRAVREILQRARKRVGPDFPLWAKINAYDFQEGGMRAEEAARIAGMLQEAGCDCVEVSSGLGVDGFATIRVRELPSEAILEWSPAMANRGDLTKRVLSWLLPFMIKTYGPLGSYNVCQAKKIKENVDIPVIVVGGIRNMEDVNNVFRLGAADFVSLGRPLLTEPDFVNKLKNDSACSSSCIDCGYCIMALGSRPAECFMGTLPM